MSVAWSIAKNELPFFEGGLNPGDPGCICSYCGRQITVDQPMLHIEDKSGEREARLCVDCRELLEGQLNIRDRLY